MSELEVLVAIEDSLPPLLKGVSLPRDNAERLALGRVCSDRRLHAAAVRFWSEAFANDPRIVARYRYGAARSAALAGSGKGDDDPKPDEAARAALRGKAKDWLREELRAREDALEAGTPETRATVAETIGSWKWDSSLAGVREVDALEKLPVGERKAWEALWEDADSVLAKAGAKP